MGTQHDTTVASTTVAHLDHVGLLGEVKVMVAGLFGRRETWVNFGDLVAGLLLELPTVNCWTIAVRNEAACREWIMLEEGG